LKFRHSVWNLWRAIFGQASNSDNIYRYAVPTARLTPAKGWIEGHLEGTTFGGRTDEKVRKAAFSRAKNWEMDAKRKLAHLPFERFAHCVVGYE